MDDSEKSRKTRATDVNIGETTIRYTGEPPFLFERAKSSVPDKVPDKEDTAVLRAVTPPAEAATSEACLVVIYGNDLGRKHPLSSRWLVVGRDESAEIPLDEAEVSRNHCRIRNEKGVVTIRDLGSTNGTFVNDKQVEVAALRNGDLIRVGGTILKFLASGNVEASYHEELFNLTTQDGLTQAHNKRHLLDMLRQEVGRAKRYRRPMALLMLDIDHFKLVNDVFGHLAGDYVLKQMVKVVQENLRSQDIVGRFGGEEFMIVLPEVRFQGAMRCAEKLRELVEQTRFIYEGSKIPINISIGVVAADQGSHDVEDMVRVADTNLYEAKRKGRNQVHGSFAT